jgi:hypothetical protein
MNDKRRPISERVAELFGKTGYRDIRDGIGGGFMPSMPRVAAELGLIQQRRGELVIQALETYYGSTLIHERPLRRAWDSHCRAVEPNPEYETAVLGRMGCALAVRRFAGLDYSSDAIAEYAWIIKQRKESLRLAVMLAEDWMDELWRAGLQDLKAAFRAEAA